MNDVGIDTYQNVALQRPIMRFDPRTKILLLLAVNCLNLATHSLLFEMILFFLSVSIMSLNGQSKSGLHFLTIFLIMVGVYEIVKPLPQSFALSLTNFVVVSLRKFLPCIMLGNWIVCSTEVSEFVAAMWKLRLPQTVIIPLSVTFRYFPAVKEEWTDIRDAMKMRGINISIKHVLVPLIISAVKTGDELAEAALCRGLDNPSEKHTCMCKVGIHFQDIAVIIIISGLIISLCI
mgnify:FL=1